MAFDRQVEASEPISGETVSSSLKQNGIGSEVVDDLGDDRLESMDKALQQQ